jgi:membrane-bound metal-dependent hydrolase YbcI (DUF457 family)
MSDCFLSEKARHARTTHRCCSDSGFMGRTHATSALAALMAVVAFLPIEARHILGVTGFFLIFLAAVNIVGASLIPDLDNTSSTARNSLGIIGEILSTIIRSLSEFLQTTIRTSRDKKDADPHRGAFHTIPAAALTGLLAWFATRASFPLHLPLMGNRTLGFFLAIVITSIMLYLALSGLAKPLLKTLESRGNVGDMAVLVLSFIISYFLFRKVSSHTNFEWLGIAIFLGGAIHIFGDCFTTSGAPILFPLSALLKGKFWWNTRFLPIKAGGAFENFVFVPFFVIVTVISLIKLVQ